MQRNGNRIKSVLQRCDKDVTLEISEIPVF